jgi:hypothetical protein
MIMLRIEHPIPNYEGWKQAFDSDPVGREKSGVRRYQILRPIDNPNYVMIDLAFDTIGQAEALLAAMRVVWERVEGTIMMNPQTEIVEVVETKAIWSRKTGAIVPTRRIISMPAWLRPRRHRVQPQRGLSSGRHNSRPSPGTGRRRPPSPG